MVSIVKLSMVHEVMGRFYPDASKNITSSIFNGYTMSKLYLSSK